VILALALLLHQQTAPNQNNRYVKFTCMEGRLRVAYTILYGDLPAENERKKMDSDGDGAISDAESRAFAGQLAQLVTHTMTLEIDGQRVQPRFDTTEVGLGSDHGVHPVPFSVDLVASFTIMGPGGDHTILFDDRYEPPKLGETEIVLEEAPGTKVTASWAGKTPKEGLHGTKWLWPGPRRSDLEDRALGFSYNETAKPTKGATLMKRFGGALVGLALALIVGVLVGVVMIWRTKKPTSTT
jgi:hypothetical protein